MAYVPINTVDELAAAVTSDSSGLPAPVSISIPDSANTSVQRSSAGFMAPGQVAKQFVAKVVTSTSATTTITLYTVTAGKTFYITDIAIFTDSSSQAIDGSIQAAGTKIFNFGALTTAPAQSNSIETQPFATAGQVVTILLPQTTGVQNVWYNVYGFEQ